MSLCEGKHTISDAPESSSNALQLIIRAKEMRLYPLSVNSSRSYIMEITSLNAFDKATNTVMWVNLATWVWIMEAHQKEQLVQASNHSGYNFAVVRSTSAIPHTSCHKNVLQETFYAFGLSERNWKPNPQVALRYFAK